MEKTPLERLAAAWYLICAAYNLDCQNPPRMDRSAFAIKKADAMSNVFNLDFQDFIVFFVTLLH
jgi:hypothetical protein